MIPALERMEENPKTLSKKMRKQEVAQQRGQHTIAIQDEASTAYMMHILSLFELFFNSIKSFQVGALE